MGILARNFGLSPPSLDFPTLAVFLSPQNRYHETTSGTDEWMKNFPRLSLVLWPIRLPAVVNAYKQAQALCLRKSI